LVPEVKVKGEFKYKWIAQGSLGDSDGIVMYLECDGG
jgi:hypothetical protein